MKNMIKNAWDSWSTEQRLAIANRVAGKTVLPGARTVAPLADKMISRAEFCTVAYTNIMNRPWDTSFGNLVDNCWQGWSEKERSNVLKRISDQGIRHMLSIPKEKMLRHDT